MMARREVLVAGAIEFGSVLPQTGHAAKGPIYSIGLFLPIVKENSRFACAARFARALASPVNCALSQSIALAADELTWSGHRPFQ